jgi:VWFA-related protein
LLSLLTVPHRRNPLIALILLCLVGSGLTARQEPARQQPGVTFRVEVNFVELDAVVTDAQGNFVRDLTKDDFELFEEGEPQSIAAFTLVDLPIRRPDPPLTRESPIEPDVTSNLEVFDGRVMVLLLDDLQTDVRRSARVRAAARQFVQRFVSENDLVAVIHTGSGARAGQEFTSSKARLLAAIDRFHGQKLPSATLARLDDYYAQRIRATDQAIQARDTLEAERAHKARSSLNVLEAVAQYLSNIRGRRKAVVWFGEGIDYDIYQVFENKSATVVREDMRKAIETATRAGVSFYGVDPRGIGAGLDQVIDIPNLPVDEGVDFGPGPLLEEVRRAQDMLRTMSAETGGFAIVNHSDLNAAFARIIEENSSYYLLGYYPSNDKRDGRFRKVEVRVRRPGLKVRWRDGYTAPKGRASTSSDLGAKTGASPEVRAALDSPIPVSGLPMRVFAAPFLGPSRKAAVAVVVEFNPDAFAFVEQNGTHDEELELVILPVDAAGRPLEGVRTVVPMRVQKASLDLLRANGFAMAQRLDLSPGKYQLHVAARTSNARRTGAVRYDLDVPDFTKQPLSISGIAVTSVAAARVPAPRPEQAFLDVVPDLPSTRREFSSDDTLSLFWDVYDTRVATPHRVAITATITGDDGRVMFKAADERASEELGTRPGGFVHRIKVPLQSFAPGRYVLRVEARMLIADGGTAVRELEFRVR